MQSPADIFDPSGPAEMSPAHARCQGTVAPVVSVPPPRRLRAVDDADVAAAAAETTVRASALRFSETVRIVVALARRGRLRPPVFRSPPRLDGVDRSIRRRSNGTVVVAIRRSGRPLAAVQADVIEGIVVANGLAGERADRFRRAAWDQLSGGSEVSAGRRASMGTSQSARVA